MLKKIKNYKFDYVKHARLMSLQFGIFVLFVVIAFPDKTFNFITYESALLLFGTILLAVYWYKFMRSIDSYKKILSRFEDFRGFRDNYLFVKLLEILAQQFFVIYIFNVAKFSFSKYQLGFFVMAFASIHFFNYIFNSVVRSTFFLVFSIPASFMFYLFYDKFPNYGLGLSYLVHVGFYLILGYVFAVFNLKYREI